MKILSNGFFDNRIIDIDLNEDLDFSDLEEKANFMVWESYDLINDLDIFKGKIDETQDIAINYYVEFDKKGNFYFTISFYDFDENYVDKDIMNKIREIEQEICIVINTNKEKIIFNNAVLSALQKLGYNSIKEVFEKNL